MLSPQPPLIGLAHGSRDPRAAVAILELLQQVQVLRPGLRTVPAFLDLSEPDLLTATRALAEDADEGAVVLPLLFTEAFHARIDTPEAVAQAQAATGVRLTVGEVLGMGEEVLQALQDSAAAAGIAAHEAVLLLAVGSSREEANVAVHGLADRWSERRPGPVWAGFATVGDPPAAAVLQRARSEGRRVAVVPLFLAPGLLLDAVGAQAGPDVTVARPLGSALAGLVVRRYDEARAGAGE